MTQRRAAQVCGVPQSVISAYERGRRDPSIATLRRLLDPLGFDVNLTLVRRVGATNQLSGPLGGVVRQHRDELVRLLRQHGATRVWVVGPVVEGHEHEHDRGIGLHADVPEAQFIPALSALVGVDPGYYFHLDIAYPLRDGGILLPRPPYLELT